MSKPIPDVEKEIEVGLSVDEAFNLFTAEIGSWWPLTSHSVSEAPVACYIEGHVGGRVYEVDVEGNTSKWGTLTEWDPVERVAFTWHPGRPTATAQQITVTFTRTETGARVQLTHSGWDALIDDAEQTRDTYVKAWDHVLGYYTSKTTT